MLLNKITQSQSTMTKLKSTYDTTTVIHIQILYFTPNQMQTFYTMMVKLYETSKSLTFVKHLGNQTSCVGKVLQGSATFTRCKVTRWKSMPVSCRKKNTNWMDDLTVNQLGGGKTRGRENQKTRNCFLMIVFEHVFFCTIVILQILDDMLVSYSVFIIMFFFQRFF